MQEPRTAAGIGVFGSANMDLVVRVATPPLPGETVFGESFETVAGGKGLNQAVAAARAGGHVRFIGCVGTDAFGNDLLQLLDAEGIGSSAVLRIGGATGTAHITVDAAGQNSITVVSGANLAATGGQLTLAALDGLGWLVTQLELPLEAVGEALDLARAAGIRTVLTPAPARKLEPGLLARVDLLVPNQLEAAVLSGLEDPRAAAARLSETCGDVVVTMGEDGAVWARGGEVRLEVPAVPVAVIDTTGAGDTFVGVLVALLSEGRDMAQALDAASRAASISVGRHGATSSMPSRAELDASIERRVPDPSEQAEATRHP